MPRTKKTVDTEKKVSFYQAIGRRKESTARVKLYVGGHGEMTVNNLPISQYFPGAIAKIAYLKPFQLTDNINRFNLTVKVEGGGRSGQLGAIIHGIARAIEKIDRERYRPVLKKAGFLTRDSRTRERRKAGFAGKSRAKKQSPKR